MEDLISSDVFLAAPNLPPASLSMDLVLVQAAETPESRDAGSPPCIPAEQRIAGPSLFADDGSED